MSQDVEPTIIEYARFYGLACDHRQLSPLQELTSSQNLGSFLDDPPELVHIDLTNVKVPEERLAVDVGAASLLSSIVESAKHSPSHSDQDLGTDRHRVRRMKHELPLLRSDHELDVLRFKSPIVPHLGNESLPFEAVDVEEDEGLEWPSMYYALPNELVNKSRSEKIEASKDDFLFLQHTLNSQFEAVEHGTFEVDDLPYKRVNGHDSRAQELKLILNRQEIQNLHHLLCYNYLPAPNHMYPHPIPAALLCCQTLPVQHGRKHANLSV